MKTLEIFRFELSMQSRRITTWIFFAGLFALVLVMATQAFVDGARRGGYFFNAPFVIAVVTVLGSMAGLLVTAGLAGDAGSRDVSARMHPLIYTTPISKRQYLGGRFLAAFVLNMLVLLAVPMALVTAALFPGLDPALLGPARPAAYLSSYLFFAGINAFIATALLFSLSVLSRHPMASYAGGALLVLISIFSWQFLATQLGLWDIAKLTDPFGLAVLSELSRRWTPLEKSTLAVGPQAALLANRMLWLGITAGALALMYVRFRFTHHTAGSSWKTRERNDRNAGSAHDTRPTAAASAAASLPHVERSFGAATGVQQMFAIARGSARLILTGWGGLAFALLAIIVVFTGPMLMQHMGVPLHPTTAEMTSYLADPQDLMWLIIPLLIVFYAGELVWRERDHRLSDIADAAPVPEWASFAGRFLGLALSLAALQALMTAAAIVVQARLGTFDFELPLYLRVLFGIQLSDYLLFAMLALALHVLVDNKYVAHAVAIVAYGVMTFSRDLGIEHNLLVYASDPGWRYSDMRGFGAAVAPLVWFKLYWASWALLLGVLATLFWMRGKERGHAWRLELARRRFTRKTKATAYVAVAAILTIGSFIFYNTNVLNAYKTADDAIERRAEYERRFGKYRAVPQPRIAATSLEVEIHPDRGSMEVAGSYELVNRTGESIDRVHVVTEEDVAVVAARFDRPAKQTVLDRKFGHAIYALDSPLQPGETLRLDFEVRYAPRGFRNRTTDLPVAKNGTWIDAGRWLPTIGYRATRELTSAGDRQAWGLPARAAVPLLEDVAARGDLTGADRIRFEAIIGTAGDQIAVAPGILRRSWNEEDRRYFHYAADAPIRLDYAIYSAKYATYTGTWTAPGSGRRIAIEILHHPRHRWNVERMMRSVQASLDYYTEHFGPYPHRQLRLVEYPARGTSLHSAPMNIAYKEGFAIFNPEADPRAVDFTFGVVAHEVAHQWWGNQLSPAFVEGYPVLTESLSWYSALAVLEQTYGKAHLERYLDAMREIYLNPRARADVPLLRADDWFLGYRKGPFAMYALKEYVGEERVNLALRRLLTKHSGATPPLPTTLDLYAELQSVTPKALHPLLVDLFEQNTFWDLSTKAAAAERLGDGSWRVTLDVNASKASVDARGYETKRAMNDHIEIGIFAVGGEPLYLKQHRITSGTQRISVIVRSEPAHAGIDPRNLLIDTSWRDNTIPVGGSR